MDLKVILFDINGTLIDIRTDEHKYEIYWELSKFLAYRQIDISPEELKSFYFSHLHSQLKNGEKYPEFQAELIFADLLKKFSKYNKVLAMFLTQIYRSLSLQQLKLYEHAKELLNFLHNKYKLAAVTDSQKMYAISEMQIVDILKYFDKIVISGEHRYRKPDIRMFQEAMDRLNVNSNECIFIGNDIYTDIYGARQAGLATIMFYSNQGEQYRDGIKADFEVHSLGEIPEIIKTL